MNKKGILPSITFKTTSDVDDVVKFFIIHKAYINPVLDRWIKYNLQFNDELKSYYHRKMSTTLKNYKTIAEQSLSVSLNKKPGKRRKVIDNFLIDFESFSEEFAKKRKSALVKEFKSYKVTSLPQPVASLAVANIIKSVGLEDQEHYTYGDVIAIYAKNQSLESINKLLNNDISYGDIYNAFQMGYVEEKELPKNAYVGFIKIGKRVDPNFYEILHAEIFDTPQLELSYNLSSVSSHQLNNRGVFLENRIVRISVSDIVWEKIVKQDDDFYFYWQPNFDKVYSSKYGLGDEVGLYDIIFCNRGKQRRFSQIVKGAISREKYSSDINQKNFYAMVFHLEELTLKRKYEDGPFDVLKKKDWILDWNCVKFKKGYFVVVPPVDGSVKFKPIAVSSPGVIESFNYLKEYLNDRLDKVHCSVEELKLNIYDKIRLEEAIQKFATVSKQRAIKTNNVSTGPRIAPLQMSFKQALSKAMNMTPEEFEKYKSKYIDALVKLQDKNYKVIPCVERLAHTNSDITEYAFMFSIKCNSGNIMVVHENVNPDRSTLLFIVKEASYDNSIREIYNFLQSAEINKRSNLRSGSLDIENSGVVNYRSINHDDVYSWNSAIRRYIRWC